VTRNRDVLGLVSLWLIVTAYNLFKPFHIDDTAHLIISAWILHHPLHPMRGVLNWSGTVQPIYETNQPPLYFYLLALWERLFGFSEPALHTMQSLFAAACIGIFHRLARHLAPAHALWLTAMLALNPAFIVEQNLMVDVPLLACWLGFFTCIICGIGQARQHRRFALAAVCAAAAVLMKYSSLVLIPVLLIALLLERRARQAWCLLIPVVLLAAWSAFNVYDYGGVHLLTGFHASAATYTPHAGPHRHFQFLHRLVAASAPWKLAAFALSWDIGLGALSCFGVISAGARVPRAANATYLVCLGGLAGLALAAGCGLRCDKILVLGFALNGGLTFLTVLRPRRDLAVCYLQLWIILTSLFYIFASPFIAARHILLILPAVSLVAATGREISRNAKIFGLLMTGIIAAGLCLSDFRFAEFYKRQAVSVRQSLPGGAKIWAAGHWGWQYYATQNGMAEIDANASVLRAGDYLIIPPEVDYQLPADIRVKFLGARVYDASAGDPFCTGRGARFYGFWGTEGPWSLSADCDFSVEVFEVK